jgi:iron(III) transport system substrate-binding protein
MNQMGASVSRRGLLAAGGLAVGGVVLQRMATSTLARQDASPEPGSAGSLTIYSGRNELLVGPLIEQFALETGIDAQVRYGNTAELAATILDEGDNSPADLFFSQDAGALGALAAERRLLPLPEELLGRVDSRFHATNGDWIGISGRARVAVYNTDLVTPEQLPASVVELTDPVWRGRVGWAPPNASFQAFVTAFRVTRGEEAARDWLVRMLENRPVAFDDNGPLTLAVGEGELPVGLVNHYYMYEIQEEEGKTFPLANHYFSAGDPGSLVNVAGVGLLDTAANTPQALAFTDFLLGQEAQSYFAGKTYEYPLVAGVDAAPGLVALADIESPTIDLGQLADLQGTLELLMDVGVI